MVYKPNYSGGLVKGNQIIGEHMYWENQIHVHYIDKGDCIFIFLLPWVFICSVV